MEREVAWREGFLAAVAGVVVAVLMSWPLALHLGSEIGKDLGDPLLQAWQVAWIGHALLTSPLDLWQANTFWPYHDTLAFSDALVGYAPVGLLSQTSPHGALVGYNALFLLAYALAFVGAYLLARELGTGWLGAAVAGAAFAYAPWKLTQNGHLHVLSSGGIPLALFILIRGYRRGSRWTVLAGWLVASWQMSLGFTLGLQLFYLLVVLALGVGLALWRRWLPLPDRRVLGATLAGAAIFVVATGLMARPYLRVLDAHPEAERTPAYVETFSPRLRSFLAAPAESWLLGDATLRARAPLPAPEEMSLFPGFAIVLLALVGALGSVFPRRLRVGLVLGTATCAVLSLGVRDVEGPGRYLTPYRFLFDYVPGWDGVRTPGRINTLTSLGLALLAGAGLCVVVRALRGRMPALAAAAGVLGVALVLVEGLGPLTHPRVTPPPAAVRLEPGPQLHLPTEDSLVMYWSTDGFPKIVNGFGGFDPTGYDRLRKEVAGFPDARSVQALRELGVRTVLFNPALAPGTVWEDVSEKSTAGLGLERRQVGDVTVFRVRPS
jgi:hypothetical protein